MFSLEVPDETIDRAKTLGKNLGQASLDYGLDRLNRASLLTQIGFGTLLGGAAGYVLGSGGLTNALGTDFFSIPLDTEIGNFNIGDQTGTFTGGFDPGNFDFSLGASIELGGLTAGIEDTYHPYQLTSDIKFSIGQRFDDVLGGDLSLNANAEFNTGPSDFDIRWVDSLSPFGDVFNVDTDSFGAGIRFHTDDLFNTSGTAQVNTAYDVDLSAFKVSVGVNLEPLPTTGNFRIDFSSTLPTQGNSVYQGRAAYERTY